MKGWLEKFGAHIGTATKKGFPTTIVVERASIEGDSVVAFSLTEAQVAQIKANIAENPYVALAPHAIASIRAAYQFKGDATLSGGKLKVEIKEIYCTKPGPEAALRLDVLPLEHIVKFEETRWRDSGPPK
jgi:hypothetical protein